MAIEVVNRQRLARLDRRGVAKLARETLAKLQRPDASVTVAFVRDGVIRRLNREFRGKDTATDVLSFPSSDEQAGGSAATEDVNLGDVVISTDTTLRQAREVGHSFEREVSELLIHGVLHLCGYDHENDNGEMNRLELRLRRTLLDRD
ncbi:MAG TPA: rRNA maturation RNase YbeY [Blastocatellia bacterium]|nr:rRNA maturation RNase YbeY [Blastocatellia bacterium]